MSENQKEVVSYTADEMNKMLNATRDTVTGSRSRAMIVIMWRCGLRISEAIAVLCEDVRRTELYVREGKGMSTRTVPLLAEARIIIEDWMRHRDKFLPRDEGPLFCGVSKGSVGEPLERRNFYRSLANIAKRTDITKRVHPHGMRHTYAMDLYRAGMSLEMMRRCLGHQSLDATRDYLVCVTGTDVAEMFFAGMKNRIRY